MKIEQELRPCKFIIIGKNWEEHQNGLFHCFGNINGELNGIVEDKNGEVWAVKPYCIKFIDNKIKEYIFEENSN